MTGHDCCAPRHARSAGEAASGGSVPGGAPGSSPGSAPASSDGAGTLAVGPSADAGPRLPATLPTRPRLVPIPGGPARVGNADERAVPGDGEGPVRTVDLAPYAIGAGPVTTAEFAAFVAATGHRTLAEREGWSFVFAGLLPEGHPPTRAVAAAPWWRQVHGADWAHPEGPSSDLAARAEHPVVHVCREDALAFCAWAGLRLPTEVEWEHAARGGLEGARYPWGDELTPGGEHRCNVWQGEFPARDTGEDGWRGTSPVGAFPANGLGLHDTSGNVWEWTADPFSPGGLDGLAAMRGGSYLCHASYCDRYRVSGRTANTPDATSGHLGFRVAADG